MHVFPKAIVAGFAILFLMGIGQCPSQPSITEEVPVVNENEVAEDGRRYPQCDGCIKDVPGCMNTLIDAGQPFCDALHKCETNLKCDVCVTVNDKPYMIWRKFAIERAESVCR